MLSKKVVVLTKMKIKMKMVSVKSLEISDTDSEGDRYPAYDQVSGVIGNKENGSKDAKSIRFVRGQIAIVDAAASQVDKAVKNKASKIPLGDLKGTYNLWNDGFDNEVVENYGILGFRYVICISDAAVNGRFLGKPREFFNMGDPPLEDFMQWQMVEESGGFFPFKLPSYASRTPIPITLDDHPNEIKAEIVFLGDGCLRLRLPNVSSLGDVLNLAAGEDGMIEFAGVKR
ncbi:hypothetical protein B0O99DRAFT_598800 [Bisporella sp. PMI_857]|nr:hypothetical protein B0O99DRAFT_598800 [Bisporella sp. PMI_857]